MDLIDRKCVSNWLYEMGCTYAAKVILDKKRFPSEYRWILCKDCKYWSEYEYINGKRESFPWCELHMTFSKEDDFCSHAERRPNG